MANRVSLIHQAGALKSCFPGSEIKRNKEKELTWTYTITPSPLSQAYKVKLHYIEGEGVKLFVVDPKLVLALGKNLLPHVYSTSEQRLCLYDPKGNEWNNGMYFVKTIIPWAAEWLNHYEYWAVTGEWKGGGIEHDIDASNSVNDKL